MKIYGKKEIGVVPSEAAEMVTFFNIFRKRYPELAKLATHIKNEGKRSFNQMQYDRASGMVKGFADIVIIGCPAFVCEMKSKSKSAKLSEDQVKFLDMAEKNGAFVCVAYGHEAALEAVNDWLLYAH